MEALSFLVRKVYVTLFRVAFFDHDIDGIARLEADVTFVVGCLGDGHDAFALGADVDDQVLVGDDADHGAFYDTIFVRGSFRLFLFKGFECCCEIFRHVVFFAFSHARVGRLRWISSACIVPH